MWTTEQSEGKDWRQHTGEAFVWPGKAAGPFSCARHGTPRRVRNIPLLLTCVSPGSQVPAEGLQVQSVRSFIPDLPWRRVKLATPFGSPLASQCVCFLSPAPRSFNSPQRKKDLPPLMVIKEIGTPIQLFQILNVEHHMFKKTVSLCHGEFTLCSREFK